MPFLAALSLLISFCYADPSATDLQNASIGTTMTVDCLNKKQASYGGVNARKDYYPKLDITVTVKNNQAKQASFNLDVFFLDQCKFRKEGKAIDSLRARDKKSSQFPLLAGASTNLAFCASAMDDKTELEVGWTGYIVRLSAYDKPIKIVASSPALEKLANDQEKMKLLESGRIVPSK